MTPAEELVHACIQRGVTLGTAESITAGLIVSEIAAVPGCSATLRGGVVAYQTDVKHLLLDVSPDLLDHVVSAEVATAMVRGVQQRLGVDLALASTGVAGPDWLDDQPPGRVWIAAGLGVKPPKTQRLDLTGDRPAIRRAAAEACVRLGLDVLLTG